MNYSVILNHGGEKEFGCRRRCQYCNWRRMNEAGNFSISQPTIEDVKKFIEKYSPDEITISGGGDPLWRYNEDPKIREYVDSLIENILELGVRVRIITREVKALEHLPYAKEIAISLSYDKILAKDIKSVNLLTLPEKIEFTVVAPENLMAKGVVKMIDEVEDICELIDLYGLNDSYITIRENFRSLMPANETEIKILMNIIKSRVGYDLIRFLPRKSCIVGMTFLVRDQIKMNRDFNVDHFEIFNYLQKVGIIFGSASRFLKMKTAKALLPEIYNFNDIDVFITRDDVNEVIDFLGSRGFRFSLPGIYKIRATNPNDPEFEIDINKIDNLDNARVILQESDLSICRIGFHNGKFEEYNGFKFDDLKEQKLSVLPHDMKFLNIEARKLSEEKLFKKLKEKGYKE